MKAKYYVDAPAGQEVDDPGPIQRFWLRARNLDDAIEEATHLDAEVLDTQIVDVCEVGNLDSPVAVSIDVVP